MHFISAVASKIVIQRRAAEDRNFTEEGKKKKSQIKKKNNHTQVGRAQNKLLHVILWENLPVRMLRCSQCECQIHSALLCTSVTLITHETILFYCKCYPQRHVFIYRTCILMLKSGTQEAQDELTVQADAFSKGTGMLKELQRGYCVARQIHVLVIKVFRSISASSYKLEYKSCNQELHHLVRQDLEEYGKGKCA